METQYCPICKKEVSANPRYPNYVCGDCSAKATDLKGRKLEFYNTSMFGGCMAVYADNQEAHDGNKCYIDGVQCYAGDARFGGIVIQPAKQD